MPDDITTRDLATHDPRTGGDLSTAADPAPDRDPFPERVGRYEILCEIAHGGMGVVYRARDPGLNREVAVKLMRQAYRTTPAAVRRFTDEATITGQLQHPGIPPVFEVGELEDGSPFLAMKLIKGQTLGAILAGGGRPPPVEAQQQGADAPCSPSLVAVFEAICQAVGYAHAHGVIHRDLKPANVMVGSFGEVQVMDWGLAKVLDRVAAMQSVSPDRDATLGTEIQSLRDEDTATQAGSLLGTPAFMPPEQAMGAIDEIDARSDVFGLGAVLCAILTGRPPYVGTDAEDTRELAVQAKLDDAFARLDASGAEPELVALCKRCLSPEKPNRPADAGAVAAAVAALRAEADERARQAELDRVRAESEAREQRKRRRIQLALATAIALLAAGIGAFAWWLDRQATARQELRSRNQDALADLLDRCEQALREDDANRAAAAMDQIDRRLPEGGGEAMMDRVARCRADLAMLRELDAIDLFRWTASGSRVPEENKIVSRWQAAFAGYGVVAGETPAAEAADRVNEALIRARLLGALDLWFAIDPLAKLPDILRLADPDPFRDEMRAAISARDKKRIADLAGRPEALNQLAGFVAALGQVPIITVERQRVLLESALRSRPGDLPLLMGLGATYRVNQREGAADRVRWYQAATAAHPQNVAALNNLGLALLDKDDVDAAIATFREALRLVPTHAPAHSNLAYALADKNQLDEAIAHAQEATRLVPDSHLAHFGLAIILSRQGKRRDEAIAAYREATRLNPNYGIAYFYLGIELHRKGELDDSIAAYKEAIRLGPNYAFAYINLGIVLRAKGQLDEAIAAYRTAIRLQPDDADVYNNLGNALKFKGEMDEAVANFRKAIRLNPKQIDAHRNLAWVLATGPDWLRDGPRAVEHATRACELTGWKNPSSLAVLAAAQAETGDFIQAVENQKKALMDPEYEKSSGADARQMIDQYTRNQPYRDPVLARRELAPPPRAAK